MLGAEDTISHVLLDIASLESRTSGVKGYCDDFCQVCIHYNAHLNIPSNFVSVYFIKNNIEEIYDILNS